MPFPIGESGGRRYVRIEISSPVHFRVLQLHRGKIRLSKRQIPGEILNLSEGGVLLVTEHSVPEEGFILLSLNLNKLVVLEGVLGKIKRVEPSPEGDFLMGVEFVSKKELEKFASPQQIDLLPVKVASFDHKLKQIITSFLRTVELANKGA